MEAPSQQLFRLNDRVSYLDDGQSPGKDRVLENTTSAVVGVLGLTLISHETVRTLEFSDLIKPLAIVNDIVVYEMIEPALTARPMGICSDLYLSMDTTNSVSQVSFISQIIGPTVASAVAPNTAPPNTDVRKYYHSAVFDPNSDLMIASSGIKKSLIDDLKSLGQTTANELLFLDADQASRYNNQNYLTALRSFSSFIAMQLVAMSKSLQSGLTARTMVELLNHTPPFSLLDRHLASGPASRSEIARRICHGLAEGTNCLNKHAAAALDEMAIVFAKNTNNTFSDGDYIGEQRIAPAFVVLPGGGETVAVAGVIIIPEDAFETLQPFCRYTTLYSKTVKRFFGPNRYSTSQQMYTLNGGKINLDPETGTEFAQQNLEGVKMTVEMKEVPYIVTKNGTVFVVDRVCSSSEQMKQALTRLNETDQVLTVGMLPFVPGESKGAVNFFHPDNGFSDDLTELLNRWRGIGPTRAVYKNGTHTTTSVLGQSELANTLTTLALVNSGTVVNFAIAELKMLDVSTDEAINRIMALQEDGVFMYPFGRFVLNEKQTGLNFVPYLSWNKTNHCPATVLISNVITLLKTKVNPQVDRPGFKNSNGKKSGDGDCPSHMEWNSIYHALKYFKSTKGNNVEYGDLSPLAQLISNSTEEEEDPERLFTQHRNGITELYKTIDWWHSLALLYSHHPEIVLAKSLVDVAPPNVRFCQHDKDNLRKLYDLLQQDYDSGSVPGSISKGMYWWAYFIIVPPFHKDLFRWMVEKDLLLGTGAYMIRSESSKTQDVIVSRSRGLKMFVNTPKTMEATDGMYGTPSSEYRMVSRLGVCYVSNAKSYPGVSMPSAYKLEDLYENRGGTVFQPLKLNDLGEPVRVSWRKQQDPENRPFVAVLAPPLLNQNLMSRGLNPMGRNISISGFADSRQWADAAGVNVEGEYIYGSGGVTDNPFGLLGGANNFIYATILKNGGCDFVQRNLDAPLLETFPLWNYVSPIRTLNSGHVVRQMEMASRSREQHIRGDPLSSKIPTRNNNSSSSVASNRGGGEYDGTFNSNYTRSMIDRFRNHSIMEGQDRDVGTAVREFPITFVQSDLLRLNRLSATFNLAWSAEYATSLQTFNEVQGEFEKEMRMSLAAGNRIRSAQWMQKQGFVVDVAAGFHFHHAGSDLFKHHDYSRYATHEYMSTV